MFTYTDTLIDKIISATAKKRFDYNLAAIKEINKLRNTVSVPTQEQKTKIALFNGWGSCSSVFENPSAQLELKDALGAEEYQRAAASIVNAHYTDPQIIRAMWAKIKSLGFAGGRILEPSCGTGYFIGNAPKDIINNSDIYGVELDTYSADIASYLYPDARIYKAPFQNVNLPDNYFDLIIGNVPFGKYKCADSKYDWLDLSIHNYFLAKSSDLVRIGGIVCIITSPFTLDAKNGFKFRQWLHKTQYMNLLAAIRLPAGVFKGVANTMVSPDILIFRKEASIHGCSSEWLHSQLTPFSLANWDMEVDTQNKATSINLNINTYFKNELVERQFDKYYSKCLAENLEDIYSKITFFEQVLKNVNVNLILQQLLQEFVEIFSYNNSWVAAEYQMSQIYQSPHRLLGTPGVNKLYGNAFALVDDGRDIISGIYDVPITARYTKLENNPLDKLLLVPPHLQLSLKNKSYFVLNGKSYQRDDSILVPVNIDADKIGNFSNLHSKLCEVIAAQSFKTDAELKHLQSELLDMYTSFTDKYGKINTPSLIKDLGNDPRYYLLRTLEKSNGQLADIFYKRIARRLIARKSLITNIKDAIITCLNDKGSFDWEYTSKLMGLGLEQVGELLESHNLGFYNPESEVWELADKYLSGNVYIKLKIAESHNLTRNIQALKQIQPTPMLPDASEDFKLKCLQALDINYTELDENQQKKLLFKLIKIKLGSSWVNPVIYQKFAEEVLKITTSIKYIKPPLATWYVGHNSADYTEYGTKNFNSGDLLEFGLNAIDPKVTYKDLENKIRVDVEATEEARGKLDQIKSAFSEWIWSDFDRCLLLCKYYNTNINVHVERKYNGDWLQLPGSNPDIKLLPHQLNAIARGLEDPSSFFAHDVGCGKTYVLIALAMECRRLGLVDKTILAVQNGTEQQTLQAWRELYPMANILALENFDSEGRKLFTASFLTGDFDAAIVTHSQFFMMKMSNEYTIKFIESEQAIYENLLINEKNSRTTKAIKKKIKVLESRISKVANAARKDDHINFESLCFGGLLLLIDEIHMAKNLQVSTKMINVRGINTTESQRALDTAMKLWYVSGVVDNYFKPITTPQDDIYIAYIKEFGCRATLDQIVDRDFEYNNGSTLNYSQDVIAKYKTRLAKLLSDLVNKGVLTYKDGLYTLIDTIVIPKGKIVGATGTILSNTMAEIYNWMRMFMFPTLQKLDLEHFDSWASQFGDVVCGAEITPSGQYKIINRFKTFTNLSALHGLLSQFCDIVTFDQVNSHILRPQSIFVDVISEPSDSQLKFLRQALIRSDVIRERKIDPSEDNMLKVTTDLLKAALSMRLMGDNNEVLQSKIHECIWNVWKIYQTTSPVNGTQLIFCDYSVPKHNLYNVYQYIKDFLILLGVPSDTIVFIHDYNSASKRGKLFELVNSGKIRIVLGSTEKLGTGCNVHKNGLFAIHHLDAPWTPKGLIQREGRGIRQGNPVTHCFIFRYLTERLDALRWQTLQWKQAMITKFLNGTVDINELADEDEASYSYSQVKSLATGNPLLIEESNLRSELNRLLIQKRSYKQTQFGLAAEIVRRENQIRILSEKVQQLGADIKTASNTQSNLSLQSHIALQITEAISSHKGKSKICNYRGFTLYVQPSNNNIEATLISNNTLEFKFPIIVPGHSKIEFRKTKPLESIDKFINTLEATLDRIQSELSVANTELLRAQNLKGKSFEFEGKILQIQRRLVTISEIMSQREIIFDSCLESESDSTSMPSVPTTDDLSSSNSSIDSEIVTILQTRDDSPDWLLNLEIQVNSLIQKSSYALVLNRIDQLSKLTHNPKLLELQARLT